MKKLIALLTLIIMVGAFVIGCENNNKNQVSNENVEANYQEEETVKEIQVDGEEKQVVEETTKNQEHNDTDEQKDIENIQYAEDAEKVLFGFFDAVLNQDLEKARKCVLFDDLGFPFSSLEEALDYYKGNKSPDIARVEEISDDMKIIYANVKTLEGEFEESFLIKRLDNTWYLANGGVISRMQSIYTEDQIKDGDVAIYLKDIYRRFNGEDIEDIYVVCLVNKTTEKLNVGFVNRPAVIYENEVGKEYVEFNDNFVVNPYSSEYMYFTVDPEEGPVKSIILKEVMLGLQAETSDVEVFIGEMIEE